MTYPYGLRGAPAVGLGIPGLPVRAPDTAAGAFIQLPEGDAIPQGYFPVGALVDRNLYPNLSASSPPGDWRNLRVDPKHIPNTIASISISADGKIVAVTGVSIGGHKFYEVSGAKELTTLSAAAAPTTSLTIGAISPDGRFFAAISTSGSGSNGCYILRKEEDGYALLASWNYHSGDSVSWSPDSREAFISCNGGIVVLRRSATSPYTFSLVQSITSGSTRGGAVHAVEGGVFVNFYNGAKGYFYYKNASGTYVAGGTVGADATSPVYMRFAGVPGTNVVFRYSGSNSGNYQSSLQAFRYDTSNGLVTAIADSGFPAGAPREGLDVAISPDGKTLLVAANESGGALHAFEILPNYRLQPLAPPVPVGNNLSSLGKPKNQGAIAFSKAMLGIALYSEGGWLFGNPSKVVVDAPQYSFMKVS